MTAHSLHCRLPLPEGFRMADVLAFHRRDPQQLAERTFESDAGAGLDREAGVERAARLSWKFASSSR